MTMEKFKVVLTLHPSLMSLLFVFSFPLWKPIKVSLCPQSSEYSLCLGVDLFVSINLGTPKLMDTNERKGRKKVGTDIVVPKLVKL